MRAALYPLLNDDHVAVRAAARAELAQRGATETDAMLHEVLALKHERARREGLRVLQARKANTTPFLRDRDPSVRARTLAGAGFATDAITKSMLRLDPLTRALAIERKGLVAWAREAVGDRHEIVRIGAARVVRDPASLRRLLRDPSWRVRLAALYRCERLRDKNNVPALIDSLPRAVGRLQAQTLRVLVALTHADFGLDVPRWQRWWRDQGKSFEVPAPRAAPKPKESRTSAALSFRRLPVTSNRICFVIDGSRSMEKPAPGRARRARRRGGPVLSRWDLVVADLKSVVAGLPRGARFNVIVFQTGLLTWKKKLVRATPGAKRACQAWIDELKPAGWTNLFDALEQAMADDDVDSLFVLTDGVPSRGAETTRTAILEEIRLLNHYRLVEINCVQAGGSEGLGKRWHGFLEELARSNYGRSIRE